MSTACLRNFLMLFLFTIGGMTTLSAQNLGNEGGYTLPEVEVCGCKICEDKFDCDDRENHQWRHEQDSIDNARKEKDLQDLRNGEGGNPWDGIIELPEVTIRPPDGQDPPPEIPERPQNPENPDIEETPENPDELEEKPCSKIINGQMVYMVLIIMELQPPNSWNMDGCLYGYTRTNTAGAPQKHNGIDFAAPVGTPIFATYGGVVIEIIDEQVNRVKTRGEKYVYPDNYDIKNKDKNGAGNRITIQSEINGETVYMSYWHLQENTATTKPVAGGIEVGTFVEAGQLIGFSGQTGNAMGGEPHLHLATYKIVNGKKVYVDPQPYLGIEFEKGDNGKLKSTKIKTPCD